MTSLFRRFTWWMQRRRMERQLHEELQFHLSEEADERQAIGLPADQARLAARLDLGNPTIVQEDARTLWTWIALEQLGQDVRYGLRTMFKNRMFTALAALSLALGIGANTAIYSFMDAIAISSPEPTSAMRIRWDGTSRSGSAGAWVSIWKLSALPRPSDTAGSSTRIRPSSTCRMRSSRLGNCGR
jgi:macrolide transport system ATP-binding/permease protein